MGCRHYFVVDLVEELVDEGDSRFFFTNSREFSACFTTESGNPGILKSMSTSFNIERSWFASRQTTGFPVPSCLKNFFTKRTCFDFLRTGCSFFWGQTTGFLRSIMIWVWIWLVRLETFGLLSKFSPWSLTIFWIQFFHPIMFQGDLRWSPRWHVYFLVYDFSSFHPNNFRDYNKPGVFREEC